MARKGNQVQYRLVRLAGDHVQVVEVSTDWRGLYEKRDALQGAAWGLVRYGVRPE